MVEASPAVYTYFQDYRVQITYLIYASLLSQTLAIIIHFALFNIL